MYSLEKERWWRNSNELYTKLHKQEGQGSWKETTMAVDCYLLVVDFVLMYHQSSYSSWIETTMASGISFKDFQSGESPSKKAKITPKKGAPKNFQTEIDKLKQGITTWVFLLFKIELVCLF